MNTNNYDNTIIYKIVCNDGSIRFNNYVGYVTTSFTKRKQHHEKSYNNPNSKSYNLPIYEKIRNQGGWGNWSVIEIEKYPCKNKKEAIDRLDIKEEELNKFDRKAYSKEYYNDNKEERKEKRKVYLENNKEATKESSKQYREANLEKIKLYQKQYNEKNREKRNARDRARRLKKKQNIDIIV
jgi:hypothetical protein